MKNLVEKIKQTTLKQRVATGAIILLLIGGGTALAVNRHNEKVLAESEAKIVKANKKANLDKHLKADKEAKAKALRAESEAKAKLEAEKKAKLKADTEAKQKADNDAKAKAEAYKAQEEQAQATVTQQPQPQGGTGNYIAPDGHEYEVPTGAKKVTDPSYFDKYK
ncbi:MAG: hypothetical protein WAX18_05450 [Lactococcus raffinolactis]